MFVIWEHCEDSLHHGLYKIISHVNSFHPTFKLHMIFLDNLLIFQMLKLYMRPRAMCFTLNVHSRISLVQWQLDLILLILSLPFLIRDVTNLKNGYSIEDTETNQLVVRFLEARKLNGSALNFLKGSTKNIIFRLQPKLTSYLKRQGNFQLQTSSISVNIGFRIPKQGKSKFYVGSLLNYDF